MNSAMGHFSLLLMFAVLLFSCKRVEEQAEGGQEVYGEFTNESHN